LDNSSDYVDEDALELTISRDSMVQQRFEARTLFFDAIKIVFDFEE
jgi:hypothetical protein